MGGPVTERFLIIGATSGIGRALAKAYSDQRSRKMTRLVLAGRDITALKADAKDLHLRTGQSVTARQVDVLDASSIDELLDQSMFDYIAVCHGVMLDNATARADPEAHRQMIEVNYTATALMLEKIADHMCEYFPGTIAVLSSVAGDRGRGSNYCYGATKAAISAYADGLRGRLATQADARKNNDKESKAHLVHIVTVKPGPVKTPMTHGMDGYEKMADPDKVARQILRAMYLKKNVVYTPSKWRLIMAVIRAIPEWLFKRLSI